MPAFHVMLSPPASEAPSGSQQPPLIRAKLKTPRSAAIAGVIFSVLLLTIFWLLRTAIPADPLESGAWLGTNTAGVGLAMQLVPVCGIAFLWFIGVLRDRLGGAEDRFFATIFLGSGLLFLSALFVAASAIGAIIIVFGAEPNAAQDSAAFRLARAVAYTMANVYAIKTAAVFMISVSTIAIQTGLTPRWIAFLGFALALIVLFGSNYLSWSFVVMPLWVLLTSCYILIDNFRHHPASAQG
jgi:hypothetical protein